MNKYLKPFITDFKKINLYGDGIAVEKGIVYPYRGKRLDVKIIGLFWLTYNYFEVKPKYNF